MMWPFIKGVGAGLNFAPNKEGGRALHQMTGRDIEWGRIFV